MRRGRRARQAAAPLQSAVAAGLTGGKYQPLTNAEMASVHNTILDAIENIGVADPIPIAHDLNPDIDAKIRERFPIQLDRALMSPGSGRW